MNVKFNGLQKVMSRLALLLIAVVMFGCKDDLADPPVIKVYVNGAEYDATERFTVATGDRISYSFEVFAHTGIATVKEIRYQVLSDEVKVPTERLVAGLPDASERNDFRYDRCEGGYRDTAGGRGLGPQRGFERLYLLCAVIEFEMEFGCPEASSGGSLRTAECMKN